MPDLLLELFSEEIPARMQARAAQDLQKLVTDALAAADCFSDGAKAFATPRRLTLAVTGLPERQPDKKEERKGPKVGAPEKAVEGFLRATGLTLDQCETREDKKGAYYVAIMERKGRPTPELIADIVTETVRKFPWPKSMRWGAGSLRWVRPLHSILCTFDGEVVPFEIDGIKSGDTTLGHRFMGGDKPLKARYFEDYELTLKKAHVMLEAEERAEHILADAKTLAQAQNLELIEDAALLKEVAGLVEWPTMLMGKIDEGYMDVPGEVLTSTMRANQKYFSLRDPKTGKLAPRFIVAANLKADDGGKAIINGNERVLRARFADAKFLWEQDKQTTLEARLPKLDGVVFHAKFDDQASLGKKAFRISELAGKLAEKVPGADAETAKLAGKLAKADLVSGMVYEFPELQGLMGRYYSLEDGIDSDVANAIAEHYAPLGPTDEIPNSPVGKAVALADKIDTLVGFFSINEKPTGSKDPYALRRAALGVVRIILEGNLRLNLRQEFGTADFLKVEAEGEAGSTERVLTGDLMSFFADRLKTHLRDQGARHDLVDAVFALENQDDLVLIVRRVDALSDFLSSDDGANLVAGYKRAANILKAEEKKDNKAYAGEADPALFTQEEERALFDRIEEARAQAEHALAREDFAAAMTAIAKLRGPVDAFFEKVTVNADKPEVRKNRLLLLSQIRTALHQVADFSKIEG